MPLKRSLLERSTAVPSVFACLPSVSKPKPELSRAPPREREAEIPLVVSGPTGTEVQTDITGATLEEAAVELRHLRRELEQTRQTLAEVRMQLTGAVSTAAKQHVEFLRKSLQQAR